MVRFVYVYEKTPIIILSYIIIENNNRYFSACPMIESSFFDVYEFLYHCMVDQNNTAVTHRNIK